MSGGQPNILLPLIIVVGVSAIKDIIEDLKRKKADKEENESKVLVADYSSQKFIQRDWQDLKIGDKVKV